MNNSSSSVPTLKERQIGALKQMLNLNEPDLKSDINVPVWKVLIYDRLGQDIISPLISTKALRDLGVTLYMQLHTDRDPIPEVPAIYFCAPSDENVTRIGQDFQNGLYDSYHLNFINPISRARLENLAAAAWEAGVVANIHKVYDQYLNFITLEDDLFILRHQNSDAISYHALNRGEMKDTEMDGIMDIIVNSLFSVFVTLGAVPIIRCPKGNAAEMVSQKLDKIIRDTLKDPRNTLFQKEGANLLSFQRPLLIVLDRNVDMATVFHHTWTYQALTHDIFNLSLNRIVIDENIDVNASGGARPKAKTCELDDSDKFWVQHKGSPFPRVAEAIQEQLEEYRNFHQGVNKLKTNMDADGNDGLVCDNNAQLLSAANSLPQFTKLKQQIDMHTNIATGILNSIKSRRLDTFFELEEKIMSKQALDRSIWDIINDSECGLPEDKLRLFIIYYLCTNLSEAEYNKHEAALLNIGCDLTPLNYLKGWRNFMKITGVSNNYEGGTKTVSMFSKLMNQGSSFVMEGVKNLVVKKHKLPVTKIVDDLIENRQSVQTDDYCYFDPKQFKPTDQVPRNKAVFQEAIVFIVGGGNYIEYQNLTDYVKQKAGGVVNKRIIYGSTALTNAKQFLKQLSLLGQEVH